MQWEIRYSNESPFWAKNNGNMPSKEIFTEFINKLTPVSNQLVNVSNFKQGEITTKINGIKYIEIKNENETYYYYVNKINKVLSNGTYVLEVLLDIYASFTLDFIESNLDKELVFLRTHKYEKECLEIQDGLIDSFPKLYHNYYFKKQLYTTQDGIWYGEHLGLKGDDLLNANKYYVFKDGVNGGYRFFPICSKNLQATIYYQSKIKGSVIYTGTFTNGKFQSRDGDNKDVQDIPAEVNKAIVDAYNNGDIVEYTYFDNGDRNKPHILETPYGTLPVDIRVNTSYYDHFGAGIRRLKQWCYVLGQQEYYRESGDYLAWEFDEAKKRGIAALTLQVKIYKNIGKTAQKKIKNSVTGLEEFRKKTTTDGSTLINKLLGIYYLPHLFNFKNINFTSDDYAYIDINPTGDSIDLFNIYEYVLSGVDGVLNNPTYSTPYLLRYMNIKYYGNRINMEYRVNNMNKCFVGGKLFFTDTASIIAKTDQLISLNQSIISYPYMLPIGIDTYEQYTKTNRGTTETSFNVAKQNQNMSIAGDMINAGMGGVKAIGKMASGDVFGGVMGMIGTGVGAITNSIKQIQAMDQMEKQLQSQYKQAQNTMSNQMMFSSIETAALKEYYDSDTGEQYEGVEISDLDENSIIMINNIILLNGYLLPKKDTLRNRIQNERIFNFIQLDKMLLNNILNVNYDATKMNNEMYQMVVEQLGNGIRIWNSTTESIPLYDPNKDWPLPEGSVDRDQIKPIAPPNPPPIPPKTTYHVESSGDIRYFTTNSELRSFENVELIALETPDKIYFPAIETSDSLLVCNTTAENLEKNTRNYYDNLKFHCESTFPHTDEPSIRILARPSAGGYDLVIPNVETTATKIEILDPYALNRLIPENFIQGKFAKQVGRIRSVNIGNGKLTWKYGG